MQVNIAYEQRKNIAMKKKRSPSPRPDILHLAQDTLGTADQVIVFGALFDAAIRATHTMAVEDTRRKAILCEAADRICEELNRTTPAEVGYAPVPNSSGHAGLPRPPRRVLRPH